MRAPAVLRAQRQWARRRPVDRQWALDWRGWARRRARCRRRRRRRGRRRPARAGGEKEERAEEAFHAATSWFAVERDAARWGGKGTSAASRARMFGAGWGAG